MSQDHKQTKASISVSNQQGLVSRIFRPIGNVVSKATIFFLGVGFSYIVFYSHFMVYLKKSDELMKNEIHSLKRLIENNQPNEIQTNLSNLSSNTKI